MAIDTAVKRRSAGGVPFLPLGPGVSPDVTKPAAWRYSAGWSYVGSVTGGLVCAAVTLADRVSATVTLANRVAAVVTLANRVAAVVELEEC